VVRQRTEGLIDVTTPIGAVQQADDAAQATATPTRPVVRALHPTRRSDPSADAGRAAAAATPGQGQDEAPEAAAAPPPAPDLGTLLADLQPALEEPRLRPSALAIASLLAWRLGFERVSIAVSRDVGVRLVAVSDTPDLAPRSALARTLERAMEETAGQGRPVAQRSDESGGLQAHRALAERTGARLVVSVPLPQGDRVCGVLLGERHRTAVIDAATLRACKGVAALLGPALELKRRDAVAGWLRRVSGRATLLLGLLAVLASLSMVEIDYRVSAPARVEGRVQRVVVAPFDGYVETAPIRAGDTVDAGQVLATLHESTLLLERDRQAAERDDFEKQYRRAMADRDWAEARVLEARMAQAQAKVDLLNARIARTRITAPFDGIVLSGDLSSSLGAPVERGEVLFEVAPLDGQRVVLQADERDVGDLAPGMQGSLALAALPDTSIPLTVDRVSGSARTESGQPVFLIEARLEGDANDLRPGMEGVAKVVVEPRSALWIVSHRLVEWLQLTLWSLLP
jgi:RND family efflux transporter MFP subunit